MKKRNRPSEQEIAKPSLCRRSISTLTDADAASVVGGIFDDKRPLTLDEDGFITEPEGWVDEKKTGTK